MNLAKKLRIFTKPVLVELQFIIIYIYQYKTYLQYKVVKNRENKVFDAVIDLFSPVSRRLFYMQFECVRESEIPKFVT